MSGGKRIAIGLSLILCLVGPTFVFAHEADHTKQEVDALNSQVKEHEGRIHELNNSIKKYKSRIAENEAAVASLKNQVALLENRIQEKQLGIQRTKEEVLIANLQIQRLDREITLQVAMIARRQESLETLLRQLQQADDVTLLDIFLARASLSDFFTHLATLKNAQRELADATEQVKQEKLKLELQKSQVGQRRTELQTRKQVLEKEQDQLEMDRAAKISLVDVTKSKEDEFQRVIYELRQQQQMEADSIADIQDRLKTKLDSLDESLARGDILLDWPVPVLRGVSAHFHDPTYPYRKFFEHPGTDVPVPVGTPVRAAAGGYVAWNRTGKQYGNYVMVVHPGGIATIYAHLSHFAVQPDTYVDRGDIIGYSGGRPGDPGAGLSTGPHLHFEVRQNGIPVNPENFLPSID